VRYEACVESAEGVLAAIEVGADRIELCADLAVGGTTPDPALTEWAVREAAGRLAVHVLIRPRGGDFRYPAAEAEAMFAGIAAAKAAGADGIVLGALTADRTIDLDLCERLVAAARPASVTFHRAYDVTADPSSAFDDVLALGVDRLLTSGAGATALDGADLIADLVRRAGSQPGRVTILAGAGITAQNAAEIVRRTGVTELHFSGRTSGDVGQPLAARLAAIMAAAATGSCPQAGDALPLRAAASGSCRAAEEDV
jgi:copper homeostasis protein